VIVIMMILAGIGVSNYLTSLKRGNDGKRSADLSNLCNALEMYYLDQASPGYPDPDPALDLANSGWFKINASLGGLVTNYIKSLPTDPKSGQSYWFKSGGSCYCLSARMEVTDTNDDGNPGGDAPVGCTHCPDAGSGEACNYTVTCP